MNREKSVKWGLVSISLFLMSHLALAPAIPQLYSLYQATDTELNLAMVENVVTLPALVILLVVAVSPLITSKLGKKATVQLGLAFIALSGLIGALASQWSVALVSRVLLGLGIGLYNSLSVSMIGDYYEGETRSTMIGLRTATLNIGKTLMTFLVGYALLLGVRYTFLVYLLALPVLWLFSWSIKEEPIRKGASFRGYQLDGRLVGWMAITGMIGLAYIGATIKIPTLLVTQYGYRDLVGSHILTLLAFSGVLLGLVFGRLTKLLGRWILVGMLLAMGLGMLCFTLGNQVIFFCLGALLIGASFVGSMSAIFDQLAREYPKEAQQMAVSLVITAGNIGVSVTPLFLQLVLTSLQTRKPVLSFFVLSAVLVCSCLLALALQSKASLRNR